MTPLSDDDKNRRIAEYLEPSASLPSWDATSMGHQEGWEPLECGYFESPEGCWTRFFEQDPSPANFANDAEMVLMLMQELLKSDKCFFIGPDFFEIFPVTPGECEPDFEIDCEFGFAIGSVTRDAFIQAKALDK